MENVSTSHSSLEAILTNQGDFKHPEIVELNNAVII
jgi:hypothetical protein